MAEAEAAAEAGADADASTGTDVRTDAGEGAEEEPTADADEDTSTNLGAHEDIDCAGEDSSNVERDAAAVSVPAAVPVRSTEDDECASASEVGNARTFGGGRAGGWW